MGVDQESSALQETESSTEAGKVFRYDCGWIGCDEMPVIVRRQFQQVEVGDVVEFIVREASSKEDTPPFCRMLGHRILAVEPQEEEGAVLIRVERSR
jgi:TusA-related sulfurtransferase